MQRRVIGLSSVIVAFAVAFASCGDDDDTTADKLGVGAECASDDQCLQSNIDGGLSEKCLRQFRGGYCGIEDCRAVDDCPPGSACVAHDDGRNYCFRTCIDKPECNRHRSEDNEANCSANIEYVGAEKEQVGKACVPPSSGD